MRAELTLSQSICDRVGGYVCVTGASVCVRRGTDMDSAARYGRAYDAPVDRLQGPRRRTGVRESQLSLEGGPEIVIRVVVGHAAFRELVVQVAAFPKPGNQLGERLTSVGLKQ
jgi:hypothetical protein